MTKQSRNATLFLRPPCMPGRRLTTIPSFLKYTGYTINLPQRTYIRSSSPIESQKRFSRSGQNLSERFLRLEETFRKKSDLGQTIPDTPRPLTPIPPSTLQWPSNVKHFRGLVIPEVPKAPEPDGGSFTYWRPPSFSQPRRMLHVWLCHMRARFIPRISR
jgi:hypothetical protein